MYESQYTDASALIATKKQWEEAENLSNPLISMAESMMRLEDPKKEWSREQVLKGLKERIERVDLDDLGGVESLLATQTYVLHLLFAEAIKKYTTCAVPEKSLAYSGMALKSQNLCRMTAATMTFMKQAKTHRQAGQSTAANVAAAIAYEEKMRGMYQATLGSRKEEPGSFEKWMAITKMQMQEG